MGHKMTSMLEDRLDHQGLQAKMEPLGHLGRKGNQGKMVHRVTRATWVLRAPWVPWGYRGQWENPAPQANKVHQAYQDKWACKAFGVQRVNLGTWVL